MAVKPIPEGYHTFTPYFVVEGATDFIDFLKKAFGGNEVYRFPAPGGKIGHAEERVGDSVLMLADTNPEYQPPRIGPYFYVTDVAAPNKKPLTAGGPRGRGPGNQFSAGRVATGAAGGGK